MENMTYEQRISKLSEERDKILTSRNNIILNFKQKLQKEKNFNNNTEESLRSELQKKLLLKENQTHSA